MKILFFVFYVHLAFGLIIPFRQFKNGLFLFFLFAGIADPVDLTLHILFNTDSNISTYTYSAAAYIISAYYLKKTNFGLSHAIIAGALLGIIPLLGYNVLFNAQSRIGTQIIFGLADLCILLTIYNFLILMIGNIYKTGRINFYYLLLVLLHLLMLLRIGTLALRFDAGIGYFVVSYFY
jgi:hypothetical protein